MSRSNHLRYRYGLNEDTYLAMFESQNGLCAACKSAPKVINGIERPLSVDHSHKSGANRGLLCNSCNLILGFAKDSQELLRRLIVYLQKHDGINFEFIENNSETTARREQAWLQSMQDASQLSL